jgi:hypothetical protein
MCLRWEQASLEAGLDFPQSGVQFCQKDLFGPEDQTAGLVPHSGKKNPQAQKEKEKRQRPMKHITLPPSLFRKQVPGLRLVGAWGTTDRNSGPLAEIETGTSSDRRSWPFLKPSNPGILSRAVQTLKVD